MTSKKYRVSADIGGTFTDIVFYDTETGECFEGKTLSTPSNLSEAVIRGINLRIKDYNDIEFFVHGTTSGLNAFLERKGAKVALLVTKGFRDIYEIARGNRPRMYDLRFRKAEPLIKRMDVYEIEERMLASGECMRPISEQNIYEAATWIKNGGYTSIAVCLINAYENPANELEVERYLNKYLDGVYISLSHRLAREWREYERTSTTVINAYIAPIIQKYLEHLERQLMDNHFKKHVHVMQSGGGVITAEIARIAPIQTLMSGPVGGAVGNQSISQLLGYPNLIGVDMGGTSYDVSLVVDGRPDISAEVNLEGFPVMTPMVNIYTIGAGGGSIAWIEAGGLRVGPQSAGADPGPACYGYGGAQPTITDANMVLGRLDQDGFLGGNMKLDREAAICSVASIAPILGMTVTET
ncbi:MAG: hydantoinase/oxoprolinase family protein, partial [Firmicutes bacterium]|nr:hydantoinase/oxoprolinase family protein [Bacillota bacterium]